MKLQDLVVNGLLLMISSSAFAIEPDIPIGIIHPEWEYTYYNDFAPGYSGCNRQYEKCGFTEEKVIENKTYWLFSHLYETLEDGTPLPLAYLREENGQVFMRLHPDTPKRTTFGGHPDTYGFKDRDLMIYDFNLETGDTYQIGEPETHPVFDSETIKYWPNKSDAIAHWMLKNEDQGPYAYLMVWDDGKLSVADIKVDKALGRKVWFMNQKCTYPDFILWQGAKKELLEDSYLDFDRTNIRTFKFVEGIGCLRSYLPFPGLYPPPFKTQAMSYDSARTPYLCEITDKATGETIYKDERRPDKDYEDSVDEIGADGVNAEAEYYTLQGIRVLNPAPGEICIVRRGAKVTKEVIAR